MASAADDSLPLIFFPTANQSIYRFPPTSADLALICTQLSNLNVTQIELISITWTTAEISVVIPSRYSACLSDIPGDRTTESDWTLFRVDNPSTGVDFSVVGVMASLTKTLTQVKVSVLALSTYNTDWVMIKKDKYRVAMEALRQAGWSVTEQGVEVET